MSRPLGLNRHQKVARRPGEERVCAADVRELVRLSMSEHAEDRQVAAELLCPCHVRRRVPEAWEALFRMMEDPEVKVRFAAWHTLEDGGDLSDPRLGPIAARVLAKETNHFVRTMARRVLDPLRRQEDAHIHALGRRPLTVRGRCDFCGAADVPVERDLTMMIPTSGLPRPALACVRCKE